MLIDSAISQSLLDITPEMIIGKLLNTRHSSLLGEIFIDGDGKLEIPMTLAKYQDGELIEIKWYPYE
jgi:hypothetical protein